MKFVHISNEAHNCPAARDLNDAGTRTVCACLPIRWMDHVRLIAALIQVFFSMTKFDICFACD